jgi:hypothetical protein
MTDIIDISVVAILAIPLLREIIKYSNKRRKEADEQEEMIRNMPDECRCLECWGKGTVAGFDPGGIGHFYQCPECGGTGRRGKTMEEYKCKL